MCGNTTVSGIFVIVKLGLVITIWESVMSANKIVVPDASEYSLAIECAGLGTEAQRMYNHLMKRVVGQEEAIRKVCEAYSLALSGLKDENMPIYSGLFCGPSGVGKTLLAEEVARYLISDDERAPLTKIRCAEFKESYTVSRLLGAPAGYDDKGSTAILNQYSLDRPHLRAKLLKEMDMKKPVFKKRGVKNFEALMEAEHENYGPYSQVILLDEIEKGNRFFIDLLLDVTDKGEVSMARNETTIVSNAFIFITSNLGGSDMQKILQDQGMGFSFGGGAMDVVALNRAANHAVAKYMSPELLNRLDVSVFHPLSKDKLQQVVVSHLQKIQDKILGMKKYAKTPPIIFSKEVVQFLLDKSYSPQRGLRQLRSVLQKFVALPLGVSTMSGDYKAGQQILFRMVDGVPKMCRKPELVTVTELGGEVPASAAKAEVVIKPVTKKTVRTTKTSKNK